MSAVTSADAIVADDTTAIPANRSPLKSPKVRVILGLVGIGALIAAAIWGWSWWTKGRFIETTNNAYVAADSVTVAPKIAGYVSAVLAQDNRPVPPGQVLVRIDSAPFAAAVEAARAEVAARRADLLRVEADIRAQGAAVDEARANASVARSAASLAETEARRFSALADAGADTLQRRDEALAARAQATARLQAGSATVRTASERVGTLRAQLEQARAAIAAAEARLAAAELDLAATEIRAVQGGRVGDRTVQTGQYVQAGTRLMTIVPASGLYIEANFKETQLARIRPGQPVEVTVDALPGETIAGVVDSLAPGTGSTFALLRPENATGNFTKIVQRVPLRIRLQPTPAQTARLAPGLSTEVAVDTRGVSR